MPLLYILQKLVERSHLLLLHIIKRKLFGNNNKLCKLLLFIFRTLICTCDQICITEPAKDCKD